MLFDAFKYSKPATVIFQKEMQLQLLCNSSCNSFTLSVTETLVQVLCGKFNGDREVQSSLSVPRLSYNKTSGLRSLELLG